MSIQAQPASTVQNIMDEAAHWANDKQASNRKWTQAEYLRAFQRACTLVHNTIASNNVESAADYVDATYDFAVGYLEMPATVKYEDILFIQDATDPDRLVGIAHVLPDQFEDWPSTRRHTFWGTSRRWTAKAGVTPNFYPRIIILPQATGTLNLRINFLAQPLQASAAGDAFLFSERWREFLSILTAKSLMIAAREPISQDMIALESHYWEQLLSIGTGRRGRRKIPNDRKGIS